MKVFLALALAIVAYQLFLPPVVGLANNGDFGKVIGIFNLTAPAEHENAWIEERYVFDARKHYWAGYYSSEQLLLGAAIGLNTVFTKDGYFDLRWIGVIHTALFMIALYLLMTLLEHAPRALRMATCGAVLFCFTDVMYASYLNSLYMDVAAWLFLSIAVMFYLRFLGSRLAVDGLGFAVCSAMAITAKAQHAVLGAWLAAVVLAAGLALWPKRRKWIVATAAFLALLSALWMVKSAPPEYASRGVFTMAFHRVLPHSRNPDRTLRDLGLDESYRRYIGMHGFSAGTPMDDRAFVERFRSCISYRLLAWFFLTHPRDAYVALHLSLDEVGIQRPYLGNFDMHSGYPRFHMSRAFAFWSGWKKSLFDMRGKRYLFSFLALAAVVATLLVVQRRTLPTGALPGGLALIGIAFTSLGVASLADAVDVPRHHLLFYAGADMLVVLLVYLTVRGWLIARGKMGEPDFRVTA